MPPVPAPLMVEITQKMETTTATTLATRRIVQQQQRQPPQMAQNYQRNYMVAAPVQQPRYQQQPNAQAFSSPFFPQSSFMFNSPVFHPMSRVQHSNQYQQPAMSNRQSPLSLFGSNQQGNMPNPLGWLFG